MNVQYAIWAGMGLLPVPAQGRGDVGEAPFSDLVGCVLCGSTGGGHPAKDVVSGNFQDWDRCPWRNSTGEPGFCSGCAWSLRCKSLRLRPHHVTESGCTELLPSGLRGVLDRPLPPMESVIVPVSRQKHVAPWAQWGMVSTDNSAFPWTVDDVDMLGVLAQLRGMGFTEPALEEPSPRWVGLKGLSMVDRRWVLEHWGCLDGWRAWPEKLAVGLRATRNDKPKGPDE